MRLFMKMGLGFMSIVFIHKFYIAVMDFESNCGDADDELKMFENTPKTKSIVATNVSGGCGTNDRTKSIGASGKRISCDAPCNTPKYTLTVSDLFRIY